MQAMMGIGELSVHRQPELPRIQESQAGRVEMSGKAYINHEHGISQSHLR